MEPGEWRCVCGAGGMEGEMEGGEERKDGPGFLQPPSVLTSALNLDWE